MGSPPWWMGRRLPTKIRITLTVRDERGKEVPFQTETRVAMAEPLNNQPRDLIPTGVGRLPQLPTQTATQRDPNAPPPPPNR